MLYNLYKCRTDKKAAMAMGLLPKRVQLCDILTAFSSNLAELPDVPSQAILPQADNLLRNASTSSRPDVRFNMSTSTFTNLLKCLVHCMCQTCHTPILENTTLLNSTLLLTLILNESSTFATHKPSPSYLPPVTSTKVFLISSKHPNICDAKTV